MKILLNFLHIVLCCFVLMCNSIIHADDELSQIIEQLPLPLLESYNYDQSFHDISQKENQPNAVAVIAFNRPNYLYEVINSLEQNPESQSMPFYFFLDGGTRSKQQKNIALINASSIKNKIIIARNRNYGCPKNHIDAKRFMFDWCGFDKVIILEEDLVVSPSFIHLNLKLHDWAKKNYSNVGIVQCWSYCYLSKKEKLKKLNLVEDSGIRWWSFVGYCLDHEVWRAIRSILYRYELFVDQIPLTAKFDKQRSKPTTSFIAADIFSWRERILPTQIPLIIIPGKKFFHSISETYIRKNRFVSQDIMMGFALWMAGYIKINTIVNRGRYIGAKGISFNKEKFDNTFKKLNLDIFPNRDRKIVDFREFEDN